MGNFFRDFGAAGPRIMDFAQGLSRMSTLDDENMRQQQVHNVQMKKLEQQQKMDDMILPAQLVEQHFTQMHGPETYKAIEKAMMDSGVLKDVNGNKFIRAGDMKAIQEHMKANGELMKATSQATINDAFNKMTQNRMKAQQEQDPVKRQTFLDAADKAQEDYIAGMKMQPEILKAMALAGAKQSPTNQQKNAQAMGIPLGDYMKEYGPGAASRAGGGYGKRFLSTWDANGNPIWYHPAQGTSFPRDLSLKNTPFVGDDGQVYWQPSVLGPNEPAGLPAGVQKPGQSPQSPQVKTPQQASSPNLIETKKPEGASDSRQMRKAASTETTEAAQFHAIQETMDRINAMIADPEKRKRVLSEVGKFDAATGKLKNFINPDADQDRSAFYADLAKLYNIVYGESGKQINETELNMLKKRIPDEWDNNANFLGKLKAFERQLSDSINTRYQAIKPVVFNADAIYDFAPKVKGKSGTGQPNNNLNNLFKDYMK